MRLSDLRDNPGASKARKRVGRGPGSGKGARAGRGQKGQKSRSGVSLNGFEGGQMPIHMRLPKRGFNKPFRKAFNEVNLARIQQAVDSGKLDAKGAVTVPALLEAGVIRRAKDGVRLLAKGELKAKLSFEVTGASAAAVKAVEAAGGSITLVEMPRRTGGKPTSEAAATGKGKPAEKPDAKAAASKPKSGGKTQSEPDAPDAESSDDAAT